MCSATRMHWRSSRAELASLGVALPALRDTRLWIDCEHVRLSQNASWVLADVSVEDAAQACRDGLNGHRPKTPGPARLCQTAAALRDWHTACEMTQHVVHCGFGRRSDG